MKTNAQLLNHNHVMRTVRTYAKITQAAQDMWCRGAWIHSHLDHIAISQQNLWI